MSKQIKHLLFFALTMCLFTTCAIEDLPPPVDCSITMEPPVTTKPNILLIIADDMGLDATPGYDIGPVQPSMPNLQNMLDNGIRFNNFWSNPVCSPTRATILTGKYGIRNTVTQVGDELPLSEIVLQKYIDMNAPGYQQAVIGKWHLSTDPNHPTNLGINHFEGLMGGGVQDYNNWGLTQAGITANSTEYVTSKFTDLAIDWVSEQTEPWFLWLAYNAPHLPFHLPPNSLHSQGDLPTDQASIDANPLPYYMAMIEAMDTEMGRLINSMSTEERENTIIIFIGDNGTPGQVAQVYNSNRTKGSVYKGGINVPLIVSGKGVERINETEDALINSTDLFATIASIAGAEVSEINDSKSFKNLLTDANTESREYIYSEVGKNTGGSDWAIRNATHKYVSRENGFEGLYDLTMNEFENPNLLSVNQLPLTAENQLILDELKMKAADIQQ